MLCWDTLHLACWETEDVLYCENTDVQRWLWNIFNIFLILSSWRYLICGLASSRLTSLQAPHYLHIPLTPIGSVWDTWYCLHVPPMCLRFFVGVCVCVCVCGGGSPSLLSANAGAYIFPRSVDALRLVPPIRVTWVWKFPVFVSFNFEVKATTCTLLKFQHQQNPNGHWERPPFFKVWFWGKGDYLYSA